MVKFYSLKLQSAVRRAYSLSACRTAGPPQEAAREARLVTFCIYKSHPCPRGSTGGFACANHYCHRPTAGCLRAARAARHEMDFPGPYYAGEKRVRVSLIYEGEHTVADVVEINRDKTPRERL